MCWNISTFQSKGNYTCLILPGKYFTQNMPYQKWVKVTQKWYGRKWVKRTKDEDDLKGWDWEVIAGQDLVVRIGSRQPGSHWGATVHFWSGRAILARRGG